MDEFAHDEGKADYRSEVLRIKKAGAKAVVNLTYIKEAATILKQAYEMQIKVQWLLGSASKSAKLVELAGEEAVAGIIGTYPTFSQETPEYKHYVESWGKKYPGEDLPIFGAYNYDMVKLTAKAIEAADEYTADAVKAALVEVAKGYTGATGDKTFDQNGDVGATYGRWTVKDGKIVDYTE